MPTVVDALVMTLGLDVAEFDKNRKRSAADLEKFKQSSNAVAKDVLASGKKMAEGFSLVKTELIGLLAVAAGVSGLKDFLHESISGMANLGRQASNLGMAAKQLDAWGAAAETVGGTADGIQSSLKSLASGIEEFKLTGQSSLVALFRSPAIHTAITDAKGQVRAYSDIMFDLADRFHAMKAQDALAFGKRMGFDEGTIQLLREGGPAVKALVAEMEKLSGATDAGVKSAQQNQAEWAKIRAHFKGLREQISSDLDPALEMLAKRMLTWLDANQGLIKEWVNRLVDALPKLLRQVNDIVEGFGGWKTAGIALGAVL